MDTKTIFATLALLGGTSLTGCAGAGADSSEVPRARSARGGQGSCGGAAKAEASCSKKAAAKAEAAPTEVAAATDGSPADVQEAAPAPAEEEEAEMLCGAPGEKRCA